MLALLTAGLLALTLGMRHAVEPDHLAAVSTLVAEQGGGRRAALLGAWWGVGHTLALLALGGLLLAVRVHISGRLDDLFELAVAGTLLVLGARALRRAHRAEAPHHQHRGRPLVVGVVHGLAGTGALTALVLGSMPSVGSGLWFMTWFGLGAIVGMALLAGLAGLAVRRLTLSPRAQARLGVAAGALSLGFGLVKGWPLAVRLLGAG
jgi:hypothetical protein